MAVLWNIVALDSTDRSTGAITTCSLGSVWTTKWLMAIKLTEAVGMALLASHS